MPKVILEFSDEDIDQAKMALAGLDAHIFIDDFDRKLRDWDKYGLPPTWESLPPNELIERIRDEWIEKKSEYNLAETV
mgnify:CR=1 FL=1|jgi:hypothetical protein